MGTDIHPAVEVRKGGTWRYHQPKTLCRWYADVWDSKIDLDSYNKRAIAAGRPDWVAAMGDRKNRWDKCKYALPEAFTTRNYEKFAVLAGVRGSGSITPIALDRGTPEDADPRTLKKLSGDHSETYVTLDELLQYDFTAPIDEEGIIHEREFLDCLYNRRDPDSWSGGVGGQNVEILEAQQYLDLFGKKVGAFGIDPSSRKYDPTKSYYVRHQWFRPLGPAVPDLLEVIEYMKALVPKGGTPEDVRMIFDFDS